MSVTCAEYPPYSDYDVANIIAPFPAEYLWSTQAERLQMHRALNHKTAAATIYLTLLIHTMILILYYGVPSSFGWCTSRGEGRGWGPAACVKHTGTDHGGYRFEKVTKISKN